MSVEQIVARLEGEMGHGYHTTDLCVDLTALIADWRKRGEALTDIAVYGCGMLSQPAAMNGPEETWLNMRIREYERRAHAALKGTP